MRQKWSETRVNDALYNYSSYSQFLKNRMHRATVTVTVVATFEVKSFVIKTFRENLVCSIISSKIASTK